MADIFLNNSGKHEKNIEIRKNETNLAKKRTVMMWQSFDLTLTFYSNRSQRTVHTAEPWVPIIFPIQLGSSFTIHFKG